MLFSGMVRRLLSYWVAGLLGLRREFTISPLCGALSN